MDEDRDLLHFARILASFALLGLIVFVVIIDRLGPVFTEQYVGVGDGALGLLLGALFALVGVQGFEAWRK